MNKRLVVLITLICATLVCSVLVSCQNDKPVKIGVIVSLSGSASHLVDMKNAMEMAAEEANSRGGINNRKLTLIFKDSKSDPEAGKEAFAEIEESHRPLLYISTLSSVSEALAPLAEERQVPLFGVVAVSAGLTRDREWIYRYWPMAKQEVEPILIQLSKLGIRSLGILYQDDEYGLSVSRFLKEEFEKAGGSAISSPYSVSQPRFEQAFEDLQDSEAIYTVGFVGNLGAAIRYLRERNFEGPILGASGANADSVRKMAETNGVYVAAPAIYNPKYLFANEMKEKFRSRYGKAPSHQAACGYDFVKLLSELLQGESLTRENVKAVFDRGFMFSGTLGDQNATPGTHDIGFALYPARIRDGEIQYQ